MKRRRRRRRRERASSGIWRAWGIYLAVLLLVSGAVLALLWLRLADYQRETEEAEAAGALAREEARAPQLAFEAYMRDKDASWWSEHLIAQREADGEELLETPKQVREYFEEALTGAAVHLFKADAWTKAKPVFRARVGETQDIAAEVALLGAGLHWEVSSVRIDVAGSYSGEIEAPEGCPVTCGRAVLSEEHLLPDKVSRFPFKRYAQSLVNPVQWRVWRVQGLLAEPELQAGDGVGSGWSEADQCTVLYADGAEAETLRERAEGFLRSYLALVVGGKNGYEERLSSCLSLVRKDSEAHEVLYASRWSIAASMAYTDLRIDLLSQDPPIRWADNCCSADLLYHAYARQGGAEKDYSREDEKLRVLFLDQGNGWEIVAFQTL